MLKARELVDSGAIGEVIYIRECVGHNKIQDMNPWFLDKDFAGGGQFLT